MTTFFEQLERYQDNVACIEGDTRLTYAQLQIKVEQKKSQIKVELLGTCSFNKGSLDKSALGISPLASGQIKNSKLTKNLVAIVANNNISTLINYLAALQLRQTILFVTPTEMEANESADVFKLFRPELILQNEHVFCSSVQLESEETPIREDVALLLSTSGSTGESKQVVLSYHNLNANCESICAYLPILSSDVTITTLPFQYSYGLSIINTHLYCGASIVFTQLSMMQREFWDLFERHQVTNFGGVPHSYDMLLRLKFTHKQMPHLRYFTQAGGKLRESNVIVLAEFAAQQNIDFYVMYGQTEATARMSFVSPDKLLQKPSTIGTAIPGCELTIVDEMGDQISQHFIPGQLVFKGENVMLAYATQRSELASFEPIAALQTGDIGYQDEEGDFFITGRVKRIVKIFGERVSLDQLEHLVLKQVMQTKVASHLTPAVSNQLDQTPRGGNDAQEKTEIELAVSKVAVIGNDTKIVIVLEVETDSELRNSDRSVNEGFDEGVDKSVDDSSINEDANERAEIITQANFSSLQQRLKKSIQASTNIHPSALKIVSIPSIPVLDNGKTNYSSLKSMFMSANIDDYQQSFELLMQAKAFSLDKHQKQGLLVPVLNNLHELHLRNCAEYHRIAAQAGYSFSTINEFPFVAVRLFKQLKLSSIKDSDVFRVLNSSGTTGQSPARIFLDKATSARQSKTLVNVMQSFIGKQRLPMLVIDSESVAKGKSGFSARTAGIQGMAFFGRKHTYALHDDMQPNWPAIDAFFAQHKNSPMLIFGFTFMVWQHFVQALKQTGRVYNTENAVLVHSGGWKKLESQKVDNHTFKQTCREQLLNIKVHNFYGMAEQVGSVFVECHSGYLHAPNMADIIIRNPYDLSLQAHTQEGLIQVLSAIPTSYPGYSILTEDRGRILGEDDCECGRKGKYFEVLGRLPKVEVRGCSDTHESS
jgi:acyl-CoA synthetase (AMP-forming)/AMP-acid ligase II